MKEWCNTDICPSYNINKETNCNIYDFPERSQFILIKSCTLRLLFRRLQKAYNKGVLYRQWRKELNK